jgi:hypothetical protein
MIDELKFYANAVLAYLGDAAHRRFVAMIFALLATHVLGKALDANDVAVTLEILIGGIGGAWSSTTPRIDEML